MELSRHFYAKALVFALSFMTLLFNAAQAAQLISIDGEIPELDKKRGYLLVKLKVGGEAPSIVYRKIKTRNTRYLRPGEEDRKPGYVKKRTVHLKGLEPGYYLMEMSAGLYQITQVNAPYYDLSYKLSTDDNPVWRFGIEAGSINYIGELVIEKERGTDFITTNLFNRFAMYKAEIEQQLGSLGNTHPLTVNPGYRDDFQMALTPGSVAPQGAEQ